jgi:hypothetical protein
MPTAAVSIAIWRVFHYPDEVLYICDAAVHTMPCLPVTLKHLYVCCPALTTLGRLPAGLESLTCSDCEALVTLPRLPPALARLSCESCTVLTTLGRLPAALVVLKCWECPSLVSLPRLPATLEVLHYTFCASLRLSDVPPFARPMHWRSWEYGFCWTWHKSVAARHANDRRHVAAHLPSAALLYV